MAAMTQTMAMSAAQSAASSVAAGTSAGAAAGTSGIVGAVTGATLGTKVIMATALTAAAVSVGAGVGLTRESGANPYCPDVGSSFDVFEGKMSMYFLFPMEPMTVSEAEELKTQVVNDYNEYYGCESDFNRLMLNSTTVNCNEESDECCNLVLTNSGPRLLCEFETMVHCDDCWEDEPLFYESGSNAPEPDENTVANWRAGIARCFDLELSRSDKDQACIDDADHGGGEDVPTPSPSTATPTATPTTSMPTLSPLTAIVFSGKAAFPPTIPRN